MKNKRFFLITFARNGGVGTMHAQTDGEFVNEKRLVKKAKEDTGADNVIVTHIFEFKSKQDWEDWSQS